MLVLHFICSAVIRMWHWQNIWWHMKNVCVMFFRSSNESVLSNRTLAKKNPSFTRDASPNCMTPLYFTYHTHEDYFIQMKCRLFRRKMSAEQVSFTFKSAMNYDLGFYLIRISNNMPTNILIFAIPFGEWICISRMQTWFATVIRNTRKQHNGNNFDKLKPI